MSSIRSVFGLTGACLVLALVAPAPAHGSGGWPWPLDGARLTGYGARYVSSQGVTCTHGGIDIAAAAGAPVSACTPGAVVFSGPVPAGEGARAWAVTVLTADGLRVTYLPLERTSVLEGETVAAGAVLGTVAGSGDPSSPGSHLHLGVRRGEVRLDPLALLEADSEEAHAASERPADAVVSADPSRTGVPSSIPVVPPRSASTPLRSPASGRASAPAADAASRGGSGQIPVLFPSAAMPESPLLRRIPRVSDAPQLRTAVVAADVASMRRVLGVVLARLGLIGLAGACAWPTLRGVLDGRARRSSETIAVRSDGA